MTDTRFVAFCPANGDTVEALTWEEAVAEATRLQGQTGAAWYAGYAVPVDGFVDDCRFDEGIEHEGED